MQALLRAGALGASVTLILATALGLHTPAGLVRAQDASSASPQPQAQEDHADGPSARPDSPAEADQKRPNLSIRLRPQTGITPVTITATAQLRGGADNYEEYYCATVQWDWGDGSVSEATQDCDPYDPATSQIDRRHVSRHTYREGGSFRIAFRLKQRDDIVASAASQIRLTFGLGPG